jgi:threonine dehydrogenase-like Zn-dependent dehydrogenase
MERYLLDGLAGLADRSHRPVCAVADDHDGAARLDAGADGGVPAGAHDVGQRERTRTRLPARPARPVWNGRIDPGRVFDLTLPLDQVAEGYAAMDQRRAIKALLRP